MSKTSRSLSRSRLRSRRISSPTPSCPPPRRLEPIPSQPAARTIRGRPRSLHPILAPHGRLVGDECAAYHPQDDVPLPRILTPEGELLAGKAVQFAGERVPAHRRFNDVSRPIIAHLRGHDWACARFGLTDRRAESNRPRERGGVFTRAQLSAWLGFDRFKTLPFVRAVTERRLAVGETVRGLRVCGSAHGTSTGSRRRSRMWSRTRLRRLAGAPTSSINPAGFGIPPAPSQTCCSPACNGWVPRSWPQVWCWR